MSKFKLAAITDWGDRKSAFYHNKDGILRMFKVLQERDGWDVRFFRKHPEQTFVWNHDYVDAYVSPNPAKALLEWSPDAILFFGDLSRPVMGELRGSKIPKGICYSGGRFTDYLDVPDIFFVESKSYSDWFKSMGKNVKQVFGTNTSIFRPLKQPKVFDAIFPATFVDWKRHRLFAEAMKGRPALACGWHQDNEPECWKVCQNNGIAITHHQPADSMPWLYNMSKTCVITSSDIGGSQRSVLEAMACGVPVVAMEDSTMTTEYVRESGFGKIVPPVPQDIRRAVDELIANPPDPQKGIDYIKSKYTEFHYATGIRDGILSICQKSQ